MNVLDQMVKEKYAIYNGDSCEVTENIPDDSIHYSLFSPPFASLYTYSNSDRDMGNSKCDDEFYNHFIFLAKELYRITMPGRLLSFHCMDLPTTKERDGVIGLKDFPAILRQIFQDCGFIYHSKVTIWKNPVTAMQRTKALGLLHKQIRKDSAMCRQGIPDYIVTMRKPGENPERVLPCFMKRQGQEKLSLRFQMQKHMVKECSSWRTRKNWFIRPMNSFAGCGRRLQ